MSGAGRGRDQARSRDAVWGRRRRAPQSRAPLGLPLRSCSAPFPSVSALAARPCPGRGSRPPPAAQPGPGAMGAAAGQSAHLGPGRPPRSLLLLLRLLLLVGVPGAARAQGTEFHELCRWVARRGAAGPGGGQGRSGRAGVPGSPPGCLSLGSGESCPRGGRGGETRVVRAGGDAGGARTWRRLVGLLPGVAESRRLFVRAAGPPRRVRVTPCGRPHARRLPLAAGRLRKFRTQELSLCFVLPARFPPSSPAGFGEAPCCGRVDSARRNGLGGGGFGFIYRLISSLWAFHPL